MDVQELVVRAVPEGVSDTVDGLGEMTDQVEDSTDQMDEQASSMADLSEEFAGAMNVAVAGLAVASGFLLSQVPVLGEAFDGLFAIVSAVAFQMDSVLRPVLSPLTNLFLGIADVIFEADGAMGVLFGTLGTIITALGAVVLPAAALASKLGLAASTTAALSSAGSVLVGVLGTIAGALSLPLVAIGALVVGLGLLAFKFRDEISNAIDIAIRAVQDFARSLPGLLSDAVSTGVDALKGLAQGVRSMGSNAIRAAIETVGGIANVFQTTISNAADWGRQLISRLIAGIKSAAGNLQSAVSGINLTAGVTIGDVAGTVSAGAQAAESGASDFIGSVGGGGGTINLDGRDVENTQGRYRADNLHRRGG